ncbi:DUF305 domain-containing protein [Sinimarinibacterium thermocellulolyticum]|uniref:DUF305 domain-containing protein n=1 Tax=Sinimarinibacterium thermocellulolyticum TaxID=3170016 RepID=A0ABV2A6C5_9GAMM
MIRRIGMARTDREARSTRQVPSVVIAPAVLLAALALLACVLLRLATTPAHRPATPSPIDIGFAQSMSLHHRQAIGMAQLMLDGRPTPLTHLARNIAAAQLLELGQMQGWLQLWDAPLVAEKPGMDWMRLGDRALTQEELDYLLDCQRSPTGMSGLATDEEVNRLRQLEGRDRDAHFLRLMLAHHEGGLPMARFVAEQARIPVVRELAARVVLEQSKEIYLMRRMLAALAADEAALTPTPAATPGAATR